MREFWKIILILSGIRIRKDGERDERFSLVRVLWFPILVLIVTVYLYNGAQNAFGSVSEWWSGVFDSKPAVTQAATQIPPQNILVSQFVPTSTSTIEGSVPPTKSTLAEEFTTKSRTYLSFELTGWTTYQIQLSAGDVISLQSEVLKRYDTNIGLQLTDTDLHTLFETNDLSDLNIRVLVEEDGVYRISVFPTQKFDHSLKVPTVRLHYWITREGDLVMESSQLIVETLSLRWSPDDHDYFNWPAKVYGEDIWLVGGSKLLNLTQTAEAGWTSKIVDLGPKFLNSDRSKEAFRYHFVSDGLWITNGHSLRKYKIPNAEIEFDLSLTGEGENNLYEDAGYLWAGGNKVSLDYGAHAGQADTCYNLSHNFLGSGFQHPVAIHNNESWCAGDRKIGWVNLTPPKPGNEKKINELEGVGYASFRNSPLAKLSSSWGGNWLWSEVHGDHIFLANQNQFRFIDMKTKDVGELKTVQYHQSIPPGVCDMSFDGEFIWATSTFGFENTNNGVIAKTDLDGNVIGKIEIPKWVDGNQNPNDICDIVVSDKDWIYFGHIEDTKKRIHRVSKNWTE
tara:strand:- start:475 stop:2169 length:1695 start_codon:yes stop_codon:yes gene_type:complete